MAVEVKIERVLKNEAKASDDPDPQKTEQIESLVTQRAEIWRLTGLLTKASRYVKKYHNKSERIRKKYGKLKKQIKEQYPECALFEDDDNDDVTENLMQDDPEEVD